MTQDSFLASVTLTSNRMTLRHKADQDIPKMYHTPKMNFLGQGFQKLEHKQDKQTNTHTETDANEHITTLHSRR